jgi:hypothetical protein
VRATSRQISFADWELMRQRDQGIRLEPLLEAIYLLIRNERQAFFNFSWVGIALQADSAKRKSSANAFVEP